MELRVENFTPTGNNFKWLQSFKNFEMENCLSKSKDRVKNKVYYDRMLNVLTDNRSIDVLNKQSMSSVTKMNEREFIERYIMSARGNKSVEQIAQELKIAMPEKDYKYLFNFVMNEINTIRKMGELEGVAINLDGETVEIVGGPQGVKAKEPSRREQLMDIANTPETESQRIRRQAKEQYTGTLGQADKDRIRAMARGMVKEKKQSELLPTKIVSGPENETIFTDPGQIPVPLDIPTPIRRVVYNRQAMPDTNTLSLAQAPSSYTESVKTDNRGGMSVLPRNFAELPLIAQQAYLDSEKANLDFRSKLPSNVVYMLDRLERGEPAGNL